MRLYKSSITLVVFIVIRLEITGKPPTYYVFPLHFIVQGICFLCYKMEEESLKFGFRFTLHIIIFHSLIRAR